MRKLKYSKLMFISENILKHEEYRTILGISDLTCAPGTIIESHHIDLEQLIIEKVKLIKAGMPEDIPFFIEHTSLTINAWRGLPGGLTSQFMKTVKGDGICRMMLDFRDDERMATAHAVIGLYNPNDYKIQIFPGEIQGTIAPVPRGESRFGEFGWGQIFVPHGSTKTYAEMTLEEKNLKSMRRKAAVELADYLGEHFEL